MIGTPQINKNLELKPLKLVLREVLIKTNAGGGDSYEHPLKKDISFENPITTLYYFNKSGASELYFESKNGETTEIKCPQPLNRVSIEPVDNDDYLTRIGVNFCVFCICGLKFYSKKSPN